MFWGEIGPTRWSPNMLAEVPQEDVDHDKNVFKIYLEAQTDIPFSFFAEYIMSQLIPDESQFWKISCYDNT